MRKHLTGLLIAVIAMSSCTPSTSTPTPAAPAMNATETSLLGTWFLKKQELQKIALGGIDTTYTGYNNSWYVTFKSNSFAGGGANWKETNKAFILAGFSANNPGNLTTYWYYDEATNFLNIISDQFKIISKSSTAITLRWSSPIQQCTLYFEK